MQRIDVQTAGKELASLLRALEAGSETEIIITRDGEPVARLVPLATPPDVSKRFGIAKGMFVVPDDFDADNEEIARLFYDSEIEPRE